MDANIDQDQEELQLKEFLSRAEIKTMRKDLAKLREADALKEKEKIVRKLKEPEITKVPIIKNLVKANDFLTAPELKEKETDKPTNFEKVLENEEKEDSTTKSQLKNYAEEAEKQRIFELESQKIDLKNQLNQIDKQEKPELLMNENELSLEKEKLDKKLNIILSEEQKIEGKIKFIEEKEKESNIPSEKMSLEKERQKIETVRQEIEKRRWIIEKELEKISANIKNLNNKEESFVGQKNELKEKIEELDKILNQVYSKISERVISQKKAEKEQKKAEEEKTAVLQGQEKEGVRRQQKTESFADKKENLFLKGISSSVKEKLKKSFQVEEDERKKFIENINKMSESDKSKQ